MDFFCTLQIIGALLKGLVYNHEMVLDTQCVSMIKDICNMCTVYCDIEWFLCQLTCQSADIMSSLCGMGVRVRVNNFFSKTTRPRDMLFFLKDTLSIEDEKLFKACKSVFSSVC